MFRTDRNERVARAGAGSALAPVEADGVGKQTLVGTLQAGMSSLWSALGGAPAEPAGAPAGEQMTGPGEATRELQRILSRGDLATVEAALDALRATQRVRDPVVELDQLSFSATAGEYLLEVMPRTVDAMIPALQARADELRGDADADPAWAELAEEFNREFAGILHIFGLDARDDTKRDPVIAARLQFLFTETQRDLLIGYCRDGLIPDRLFDGDEPGRCTAQQRIVIAGQILADGKYAPGSTTQEVHARACFHWARITYQYAGVATEKSTQGLTGSFDVNGGVVLGSGALEEPFHGKRDPSLEASAAHKALNPHAYRFGNAPWAEVMALQPGDWLYIYAENKTGSGAHSVIFAGWEGEAREQKQDDKTRHFRACKTFDQGLPKQGGNLHHRILGDDLFVIDGTDDKAQPVNDIMRVDPDAAPADEIADLTPKLAKQLGKQNQAFVTKLLRRHPHHDFDQERFLAWLRAQNVELIARIDKIEGRLTDGQKALFHEANASAREGDVICLTQRLVALAHNSELLATKTEATYAEDLDIKNAAAQAAYEAEAVEVDALIADGLAQLEDATARADVLRAQLDEIDGAGALKQLRAQRKIEQRALYKIPTSRKADRAAKRAEIAGIDAQIVAAKAKSKANRDEIHAVNRALDGLEKTERNAQRALDKLLDRRDGLYAKTEFGLVATANSRGEMKAELDGRYDNLPLDVPWDSFLTAA